MKVAASIAALLLASSAMAVTVGETYDAVIAEKGRPLSFIGGGSLQLLTYPDCVIKLRDGCVVSMRAPDQPSTPVAEPQPPAKAAAVRSPAIEDYTQDPTWETDYAHALARAHQEHRHLFLFFTGSDWCVWCKKLETEVIETHAFTQYARDHLVLVELDFPKEKAQSDDLRAQNHKLQHKYHVRGYPTIMVLDSEGNMLGQLGYQKGGPDPFIERLRSFGD